MSDSVVLNSSLVLRLEDLGKLKVRGQRLAIDLRGSPRVDENALERAMIAYQRAIDQFEGVIMGKPHAEEAAKDSAFVELIAGETLVVNDELSEAIQDCSRLLAGVTGTASTLMNHLTGLLAEQRAQFSTTKVVVQDQIGTV
nr:hypothetical protein [uncultured Pseudomonas sp.]